MYVCAGGCVVHISSVSCGCGGGGLMFAWWLFGSTAIRVCGAGLRCVGGGDGAEEAAPRGGHPQRAAGECGCQCACVGMCVCVFLVGQAFIGGSMIWFGWLVSRRCRVASVDASAGLQRRIGVECKRRRGGAGVCEHECVGGGGLCDVGGAGVLIRQTVGSWWALRACGMRPVC